MKERRLQRLAAQSRFELQRAAQRLGDCQQDQDRARESLRTVEQELAENLQALRASHDSWMAPFAWMLDLEARQRADLRQTRESLSDCRARAEREVAQSFAKVETAKRELESAWGKHRSVIERTSNRRPRG